MKVKEKPKGKSNMVSISDDTVMRDAKIIVIRRGYDSLRDYITEAVKEKNQREK